MADANTTVAPDSVKALDEAQDGASKPHQKAITKETAFSGIHSLSAFQVCSGLSAEDAFSEASCLLDVARTIVTSAADEGNNALYGAMVQINAAKALIDSIELAEEGASA